MGRKAAIELSPGGAAWEEWPDEDIDRVIQMAWEDRTPFEAIEWQFGLKENDVRALGGSMKRSSFEMWRKRQGTANKHGKRRTRRERFAHPTSGLEPTLRCLHTPFLASRGRWQSWPVWLSVRCTPNEAAPSPPTWNSPPSPVP